MTSRIGGQLGLEELRLLHAPKSPEEVRAALHRLARQGFSDHGIATVMGLSVEHVRQLLGPPSPPAPTA